MFKIELFVNDLLMRFFKISANVSWLGVSWGFGKPNVSI